MHSDLFLGSIIEPAMEELGLTVVRADQIGKPGMITSQVLEHVLKSRLVIADLSFHNPNVFYELALRHVSRLPTVQVIREADPLPFDLDQFRTIRINTNTIYTLVPKLAIYRAEVANQARRALEDPDAVDNPLSLFYPNLKISMGSTVAG
jgi:Rad3-related DNA helicase